MKIAIASSGLGHVARGIETWALDTAAALAERSVDVQLFAGGAAVPERPGLRVRRLACLQRGSAPARRLAALAPAWTWRWGLKNPYGWEQLSFWRRLATVLRAEDIDILHVQDPMLAFWCRRARRRGRVRTREILAHGTEEPAAFVARFDCVQHLAPWHLEQALQGAPEGPGRCWRAIPNFVDCDSFSPALPEQRLKARNEFGVPAAALVIGCVAAVKKSHKRMDYLIREFAAFARSAPESFLLIAGAREPDTPELEALAARLLPGRVKILTDLPRERMPDFYRALDLFALASLFEMMPIAVLEAMACGVPVLAHAHPVLEWMVKGAGGEAAGGCCRELSREGALARALSELPDLLRRGAAARERALRQFSRAAVVGAYQDLYASVLKCWMPSE